MIPILGEMSGRSGGFRGKQQRELTKRGIAWRVTTDLVGQSNPGKSITSDAVRGQRGACNDAFLTGALGQGAAFSTVDLGSANAAFLVSRVERIRVLMF